VLARNVMHIEPRLRDDAVGVIEFGRLGEMRDVAGMDHERRLYRQHPDLVDALVERAERIRIGGQVETHMAVADLQEGEPPDALRLGLADQADRLRHAARDRPEDAGSGPGHAFQNLASAQTFAIAVMFTSHNQSPKEVAYGDWIVAGGYLFPSYDGNYY
jgi:hypothetical protein